MRRCAILLGVVGAVGVVLSVGRAARAQDGGLDRQQVAGNRNVAPLSDGLHDPSIEGTQLLQSPQEAFAGLPKASGGNYVNWTDALESGNITPRYDRLDARAKPEVLQLDVVRQMKRIWGGTPPAVFPHAAHSEWVDCPTCHPALFVPEKGKNTMSMAEIMAGQKCGVCHGTVAFPASECKRCHYQPPAARVTAASSTARTRQQPSPRKPVRQSHKRPPSRRSQ